MINDVGLSESRPQIPVDDVGFPIKLTGVGVWRHILFSDNFMEIFPIPSGKLT